eukprot:2706929-Prymnesium_polylepis.1
MALHELSCRGPQTSVDPPPPRRCPRCRSRDRDHLDTIGAQSRAPRRGTDVVRSPPLAGVAPPGRAPHIRRGDEAADAAHVLQHLPPVRVGRTKMHVADTEEETERWPLRGIGATRIMLKQAWIEARERVAAVVDVGAQDIGGIQGDPPCVSGAGRQQSRQPFVRGPRSRH